MRHHPLLCRFAVLALVAALPTACLAQQQSNSAARNASSPVQGVTWIETEAGRVEIVSVQPASPFADAGAQAGDILVAIGDQKVATGRQFARMMDSLAPGSKVAVTIARGGNPIQVVVTVPKLQRKIGFFGAFIELDSRGRIRLTDVSPDSPASTAGLQPGDVILSVEGYVPPSVNELMNFAAKLVGTKKPGDKIALKIVRNEREQPLILTIAEASSAGGGLAAKVAELSQTAVLGIAVKERDKYVVVTQVIPNEPAHKAGIRPGDAILAVGGQPITSYATLVGAIKKYLPGDNVPVEIRRGEKSGVISVVASTRSVAAADVVLDSSPDIAEIVAEVKKLKAQVEELSMVVESLSKEVASMKNR